jgi:hypothetical protein
MARSYMITVDLLDPTLNVEALNVFITTSPFFENWWNHIPGVYLVLSDKSANEISEAIRRYTKDARLLVVEVNPAESEGWLPEVSWKWIRRRARERVNQPTEV